jgi:hypothetical protein
MIQGTLRYEEKLELSSGITAPIQTMGCGSATRILCSKNQQ